MEISARLLAVATVMLVLLPATGSAEEVLPRRVATLDGGHPAVESPDRDGRAQVRVTLDRPRGRACYRIEFRHITLRALYIYQDGSEDTDDYSPPFLKLYDEAPTQRSPLRGCITGSGISSSQIRELKRNPQRFYVKASEYDGDEIAGGLRRPR